MTNTHKIPLDTKEDDSFDGYFGNIKDPTETNEEDNKNFEILTLSGVQLNLLNKDQMIKYFLDYPDLFELAYDWQQCMPGFERNTMNLNNAAGRKNAEAFLEKYFSAMELKTIMREFRGNIKSLKTGVGPRKKPTGAKPAVRKLNLVQKDFVDSFFKNEVAKATVELQLKDVYALSQGEEVEVTINGECCLLRKV